MESNTMSALTERIRNKSTQEQQQTERIYQEQLNDLSRNLSSTVKDALTITENDIQLRLAILRSNIAAQCRALNWIFVKRSLLMLLTVIMILTGAYLGSQIIFKMASSQIASLTQEIATLQTARDKILQDYSQVEAQFKGIQIITREGKTFIVLPERYTAQPGWTMGNKEAISITIK